jgi:hypothetical protein
MVVCCTGGNETKGKTFLSSESSGADVLGLPAIMTSVSSFPVTPVQPNKIRNYRFPYVAALEPFSYVCVTICGTKRHLSVLVVLIRNCVTRREATCV